MLINRSYTNLRVAITGVANQAIDLGASYREIRVWVTTGGPEVHLNWGAPATIANASIDSTTGPALYTFASGVNDLNVLGAGPGTLCVEAWN